MYLLVKELFKFNFYGISLFIVEQSSILGHQINKYYETEDTYIFRTQISSNQFSSENDFQTSNLIANIVYHGIECLKKAFTDRIKDNIVKEYEKFKIFLAIILVVFFTNQKKEMLSILFCLDLLDIIISLIKVNDFKESQIKYCTISKVFINGVSIIIYSLAISNYFYQDQNNNYISILDTQIGLIYLIFAFLYLINISVLSIFVRAYHKKEKEFIMSFYYSEDFNSKKQKQMKQICQETKTNGLRSNEIKLSFPTIQMLHSTNDINTNEYQKKRIDNLEDKIQKIQKYLEQKKQEYEQYALQQ
ncbi:hypothetical protein ABPG72_007142 [Tetrahymena utriculariae]